MDKKEKISENNEEIKAEVVEDTVDTSDVEENKNNETVQDVTNVENNEEIEVENNGNPENTKNIKVEQNINKVKQKSIFKKWWLWTAVAALVTIIAVIVLIMINSKSPLSVSNNSLNNTREELLQALNNDLSKKNITLNKFEYVKGNKVAEQLGLELYETTLNQETVIQCVEKDGRIQSIRCYAFLDPDDKVKYKYDQSIRSDAYLDDDLSVAYKNVAFVIGMITREIGTSEDERDRVTNLVARDIHGDGVESEKFVVKLQELDYYTTGLLMFDINNAKVLNLINSEETTNKLSELKQDSMIESFEDSIKKIDENVKKEKVSTSDLKSEKTELKELKSGFEELITDYNSETEYNDFLSEYPRVAEKKENWYKQIDELIGYIDEKMKVIVPNFDSMSSSEAEKWGKDNEVTVKTSTEYSSSIAVNKKISQSMNEGETAIKGESSINVVYSLGRKPTKEDLNALEKAKSYAKNLHMSKKGIYNQLTSSYGEDFSEEAAQYAIDHLSVDYKANALEKAKSYRDNLHMSKNSIYSQLISSYGENFTKEEAQYAIDHLDD